MTASLATGSSAGGGEGSDGFSNVEVLDGGPYDDTLTGDAGDNSLWGRRNDTLSAGDGNDFLVPGSGNDVLDGGAGHDAVAYWDAGGPITADLGAGTATGDGPDSFSNVEQIHGSEFGDTLNAGTYVDAWLVGNDGNDSVDGGPGNDFVFGDAGNDTVLGGGGNDGLNGWTGDDRLYGEAGNDYLDGADGIDFLDGGPDSDYCVNGETVVNCEAPARVDLALGKQVRASNETPENPAWLAVDGNWFSYWSSGNYPPQWIEVDLGAVASVGEIDLGMQRLMGRLAGARGLRPRRLE